MSSYLAKQQAYKEDPEAFAEGQYFGASMMPGTGEAIAAYELPGILSQAKTLMQDPDALKALAGLGLGALGTAAVAPGIGPLARGAKKGLEGFIPYLGPKPAAEGVDTSILMAGFGKDPTNLTPGKVPDIEKARELGQEELFPSAVKKEDDIQGSIYATKDAKGETADDVFTYGPGSLFNPKEKKGRKLLIVSCSDKKCPDDKNMKAIDRYLGPVFQSLRKQGIPENVDVAIMSAKHGLIRANTPLKNYNEKMSVDKAQAFKNAPDQLNRIKNTMSGYDDVIVQGGPLYKDVIRAAAGDLKINEIPGGRGIGDQRKSVIDAIKDNRTDFQKEELFINMGDDGALLEYEDIGFNLNEYMIRDDRKALLKAFNSPNYESYSDVMKANLKKAFPSGKIRVERVENYVEQGEGAGLVLTPKDKQIKTFKEIDIDDVKFIGGVEERELILLDTPRANEKGALVGDKQLLSYSISKNQTKNIFDKINTPVYHYSPDVQLNFTKFDPDKSPAVIDSLGVHVGTKKAARDRYEDKMRSARINNMPTGNVGYGPDGKPIPRTTFGGTFPLLADTTKPFTPSTADSKRFAGDKEWSEFDLNEHLIDEFNKTLPKGQDFDGYYNMKHLSAEPGYEDFPFAKFREFVKDYRKKLAKDGFTHIPYLNDVEDPGSVSLIMLVDRPKGKTKVLQSPFAKKNEEAFDDPDIMKAAGGVVEMKDKAVNMYRGTQGIEPFIQYMQNGGNPELEGIIQRIREEPIMDGNTIRYRTEEEIERIIQQLLQQPNIDITPEGGIKIRPSVEITGDTPSSKTFMGTLGGEELFFEDQDLRTRARLGVDVELPKGDRAGIGARASYFKGTRDFPEQVAQFGFPDKVRRGSGKINYGDIDAYYSMQGGPTISGRYNPVTEQYGGQINYGMPLRDMGIPQLSEKAVNMFRRLVK